MGRLDQDVSFHIRVTGNQRSAVICEALSCCSAESKLAVDGGGGGRDGQKTYLEAIAEVLARTDGG